MNKDSGRRCCTVQKILLIDDDEPLRRALALTLERSGYEVKPAGNGRIALDLIATWTPDLVITDIIMPEMEGIQTILALRKTNPALPIIAMSGGGRLKAESHLGLAKRLGAKVVLSKPFLPSEFLEAVAQTLANQPQPPPPHAP